MAYDISADYVDSTTAYDPRPGPGLDTLSADSAIMANVVTTGLSNFPQNYFILLVTSLYDLIIATWMNYDLMLEERLATLLKSKEYILELLPIKKILLFGFKLICAETLGK